MMAGSDGRGAVAGGLARHIPVLARQVFEQFGFEQLSPHAGLYVDGTFGAGGHTRAILSVDGTQVIGIDRDRDAIAGGFALVESAGGRLTLVETANATLPCANGFCQPKLWVTCAVLSVRTRSVWNCSAARP